MWLREFVSRVVAPESAVSFLQSFVAVLLTFLIAYFFFRRQAAHDRTLWKESIAEDARVRSIILKTEAAQKLAISMLKIVETIEDSRWETWAKYFHERFWFDGPFGKVLRRQAIPHELVLGRLESLDALERLQRNWMRALMSRVAALGIWNRTSLSPQEELDLYRYALIGLHFSKTTSTGLMVISEVLGAWDGEGEPNLAAVTSHATQLIPQVEALVDEQWAELQQIETVGGRVPLTTPNFFMDEHARREARARSLDFRSVVDSDIFAFLRDSIL